MKAIYCEECFYLGDLRAPEEHETLRCDYGGAARWVGPEEHERLTRELTEAGYL